MQIGYLAFFYLLGSIPVAWLMAELAGRGDIRRLGSGNVGVMNVALNVSRWAGADRLSGRDRQRGGDSRPGANVAVERHDDRPGCAGSTGRHALVDLD